ncbi:MAG TPA: TIGR02587 family membrane protein [Pyrinomonadaceae bacterium]|nr:TIGR02587 family membrane protein [Pyrinomonadaceae bacterium]
MGRRGEKGHGRGRAGGPSVAESLREYGRGVAGGLIFSLPLLYTMEVWWTGFVASPLRLLACVGATYVLLFAYNHYAGLRPDASWREVAIDSVEELGLGLLLSALVLWLLGRITAEQPAGEVVGIIVIEAVTVAIGVSVGTAQLGAAEDEDEDEKPGEEAKTLGGQVVVAFCGAVLFAANVAPTEEIIMIAAEISSARALGLALFSLAVGTVILYFSEFRGARRHAPAEGRAAILVGAVVSYAVALAASALLLWFFGRFGDASWVVCLTQTVVLGVAAALGASAGRLLLQ